MAKIESYATATPPVVGGDMLIGTDVNDNNATKNFTVSQLSSFIAGRGGFVPYTGASANLNLGVYDISSTGVFTTNLNLTVGGVFDIPNNQFNISSSVGVAGQVLTSQGTGGGVVWADIPVAYKKYVAQISQFGTNPPTADVVLENTFTSPVTFSYDNVGIHKIDCADFTGTRTIAFFQQASGASGCTFQASGATGSVFLISSNSSNALQNGLYSYSAIEIREYL